MHSHPSRVLGPLFWRVPINDNQLVTATDAQNGLGCGIAEIGGASDRALTFVGFSLPTFFNGAMALSCNPAPPFQERARAEYCRKRFIECARVNNTRPGIEATAG